MRLRSELLLALQAAVSGELKHFAIRWSAEPAIGVVMAAKGYPGTPVKHTRIGGVEAASAVPGAMVFHAGTEVLDGQLVSSGGRVLTVCAKGADIGAARASAYAAVGKVEWPEGFCRSDIGWRAL